MPSFHPYVSVPYPFLRSTAVLPLPPFRSAVLLLPFPLIGCHLRTYGKIDIHPIWMDTATFLAVTALRKQNSYGILTAVAEFYLATRDIATETAIRNGYVKMKTRHIYMLNLQCGVRIGMKLDQDPVHNTCQFLELLARCGGLAASGNGCTMAGKLIQRQDMSVIHDMSLNPGRRQRRRCWPAAACPSCHR